MRVQHSQCTQRASNAKMVLVGAQYTQIRTANVNYRRPYLAYRTIYAQSVPCLVLYEVPKITFKKIYIVLGNLDSFGIQPPLSVRYLRAVADIAETVPSNTHNKDTSGKAKCKTKSSTCTTIKRSQKI